jgi:peptidyl-tRNA hydrolase
LNKDDELRIYIIVRKDIGEFMSKPKFSAQVAHAVLSCWVKTLSTNPELAWAYMSESSLDNVNAGQAKIVLEVDNEIKLWKIHQIIIDYSDSGLPAVSLITDSGRTEFNSPTLTCMGVGPLKFSEAQILFKRTRLYSEDSHNVL